MYTNLALFSFQLDSSRDNARCKTLHIARQLPAGLHLFEELTRKFITSRLLYLVVCLTVCLFRFRLILLFNLLPILWYFLIVAHPEKSLLQSGVHDGTELFLWNGEEVEIIVFLTIFVNNKTA